MNFFNKNFWEKNYNILLLYNYLILTIIDKLLFLFIYYLIYNPSCIEPHIKKIQSYYYMINFKQK